MKTITFSEISAIVSEHYARETARNAPAALAVNAIEQLAAALAACTERERREITQLVRDELGLPVCDFVA